MKNFTVSVAPHSAGVRVRVSYLPYIVDSVPLGFCFRRGRVSHTGRWAPFALRLACRRLSDRIQGCLYSECDRVVFMLHTSFHTTVPHRASETRRQRRRQETETGSRRLDVNLLCIKSDPEEQGWSGALLIGALCI